MAIRGAGELGKYNFEFLPKILTSNKIRKRARSNNMINDPQY